MQSGSFEIFKMTRVDRFAFLFAMGFAAGGCSNSMGPVPSVTGTWLGGSPATLFISFEQNGAKVRASGELSEIGTLDSFGLPVQGVGTIASDSTIRVELNGKFLGPHVLEGRLLDTGIIAGTISGDHIGGDGVQLITLARRSEAPQL
jgi:hypothetical protein